VFKTVRSACLIALALLPAFPALAETKITFIKAGRLIDVENNRVLSDQAIVVEGERIKSVGSLATTAVPAGAKVIDLSKSTVLPGLIDAHTHLTGDATAGAYKGLSVSIPREALYGARSARVTIYHRAQRRC
jgi:imidazolonepropionase-like amidohydrolase